MNSEKHFVIGSRAFRLLVPILVAAVGALLPGVAFSEPALPGVYTTINISLSPEHGATGINATGEIIGNYRDPSSHGYVLRNGIATAINYPCALETAVFGAEHGVALHQAMPISFGNGVSSWRL